MQQQGEFIAPDARHQVARGVHMRAQAPGHGLQQAVAKGVAEHVVDMLEAVQVEQQHGQRAGLAVVRFDGLLQRHAKALTVGKACEAITVGQLAHLGLLARDVQAHVVKRARQITDLVGARGVFHGYAVVAVGQPPRGHQQRPQRRCHPTRHGTAAQGHQQHPAPGDDGQQKLQLPVGRHHRIHRTQQQHLHLAPHRAQGAGANQQRARFGLQLPLRPSRLAQRCQRRGWQGADRHRHAAIGGPHPQRHVHRQQLAHLVDQGLPDGKAHEHPANHQGSLERSHDELIGSAIQHRHHAALRLGHQGLHHLRKGTGHRLHPLGQADCTQGLLRVEQRRGGRAYACTVVFQCRQDGLFIARADRRAKAVVGCQQCRALAQTFGVLIQQAVPDTLVGIEFARDLQARIAVDAAVHHGKTGQLHDQQQQQRHPDEPQDQAVTGRARTQGASPVMRTVAAAPPVVTVSAWSCAGAPTGRRGCQVRSR